MTPLQSGHTKISLKFNEEITNQILPSAFLKIFPTFRKIPMSQQTSALKGSYILRSFGDKRGGWEVNDKQTVSLALPSISIQSLGVSVSQTPLLKKKNLFYAES